MKSPPHLGKVLVDGCEGVAPCGLLQQHTEVSVGEPATFHPLPLRNAGDTEHRG